MPADNRDLNYNKYLIEGDIKLSEWKEYHSHNTRQLNVAEIKEKILSLSYFDELKNG